MNGVRYFLDVSPLRDYAWTGIPIVTARIAEYLLRTRPEATVFYYGPDVVLPQFVATAIDRAPGGYLRAFVESGTAIAGSLDNALRGDFTSVGIFPNIKPIHRVFDLELVILHDLSAILMPEMHTPEAALEHSQAQCAMSKPRISCAASPRRRDRMPSNTFRLPRTGYSSLTWAATPAIRRMTISSRYSRSHPIRRAWHC